MIGNIVAVYMSTAVVSTLAVACAVFVVARKQVPRDPWDRILLTVLELAVGSMVWPVFWFWLYFRSTGDE